MKIIICKLDTFQFFSHFLFLPHVLMTCMSVAWWGGNGFLGGRRLQDLEKVLKQGTSLMNLALRNIKTKGYWGIQYQRLGQQKRGSLITQTHMLF